MMKLSEVLERYYVLPYNSSELVGFYEDTDNADSLPLIVVSWNDVDARESYLQEFEDQEIQPDPTVKGGFLVNTIDDGEPVGFIALNYVGFTGGEA